MPIIDACRCSGCGLCVTAGDPACSGMDSVLAVLSLPDARGSEEHCIGVCADDAIRMVWLPWIGSASPGNGRTDLPVTQVTECHADTSYAQVEDNR